MTSPISETKLIRFDWAIKSILRDKANFDILEGFLSALLEEEIIIEQLLESESNAEENLKFNRVDLLVHDKEHRRFIIEVQSQREADYLERLLFGTSKVIVENLSLGEPYYKILKVISISILYFNFGQGEDYVYFGNTEFRGVNQGDLLTFKPIHRQQTAQKNNIFPDYYLIFVDRFQNLIKKDLDEWIYLFKHSITRSDFHAPNIEKAAHKLDMFSMSKEERRRYERYIESLVIEKDIVETAKQEGFKEGLEKGLEKGRQENRAAQLKLARNLLQCLSPEIISQQTGLSIQEILGEN
ncbi:conserved hypothetical protein [Gammaproteobacteria bacterium]